MALRSRVTGTFRVEGKQALIANLHAFGHAAREGYRVATRRAAQDVRDLTVQLAAKKTGYMARSVRKELTPDELEFSVFWDPADFIPHGLPYYPPMVELGSEGRPAQPALRPAYEAIVPFYLADLRAATRVAQALAASRA